MSGQTLFVFPSVDDLIARRETDTAFRDSLSTSFGGETSEEDLRNMFAKAFADLDEGVLREIAIAVDPEPFAMGGFTIPSVGLQAVLVAVYCVGLDMVTRYRIGSGGFIDLVRTPNALTCGAGA